VGDRTFAQHDEDTLARRALELLDERNDLGNAVEDVAADDQVRGRDLGVLPGARDDGQVGQRRQVGTHACGRLHRGDPLERLRQRHRVPAGAGADVDQRLAVRDERLDHRQELVDPIARRTRVSGGPAVPVIGIAVAVCGRVFAIENQLAPKLHPDRAAHPDRRRFHTLTLPTLSTWGQTRATPSAAYLPLSSYLPPEPALL